MSLLPSKEARGVTLAKRTWLWRTRASERFGGPAVEGRIYDLAIANGQLFASSDSGWIYAFGSEGEGRKAKTMSGTAPSRR